MKICNVSYCENKPHGRGYCLKHYSRVIRGVDPEKRTQTEKTPTERFLEFFKKGKKNDCWEWNSYKANFGYGKMWIGDREVRAHRFSYEHFVGPIPDGMCVLHKCDNPPCVNPNHLFIGTKRDNMLDCIAKGRFTPNASPGEKNGFSKLTDADVLKIRRLAEKGQKRVEAAKMFNVHWKTISKIVAGKTWTHI